MKKIIPLVGILSFLFLMLINTKGIYGWFTAKSECTNRFSIGMNEVEIEETFPDSTLEPQKPLKKEVRFKNTGLVPMYVRACYLFDSKEAQEGTEISFGSSKWKKESDGYYYYQEIVEPEETTELFLTQVLWKKQEAPEDFDLMIYTESVQAAGYKSAKEAFAYLNSRKEGSQI